MPTQNVLPDALTRRFAADFAALSGGGSGDRIGIALSGGPDSVALLLLAHAAFPGKVEAATVDHGLRAASLREAEFAAALCRDLNVPHEILRLEPMEAGNVSVRARDARYRALDAWATRRKLDWLATGHHADDQRETFIMRLNRGSGVTGLSSIRQRRGRIVRPLIAWRHAELCAIVDAAGITPVDDPTNRDDRFDRARLRKALAGADWLDAEATGHSVRALADADDAIEWSVTQIEALHVSERDGHVAFDRCAQAFPAEVVRRIVRRCLHRVDADCNPREATLVRLLKALEEKSVMTLGTVLCRGDTAWRFSKAPPRRAGS